MKKVLYFTAPWCKGCIAMKSTIDSFSAQYPVEKVNVDMLPDYAKRYRVYNIPTFVFLKDGQEVTRTSGMKTFQQLVNIFNSY